MKKLILAAALMSISAFGATINCSIGTSDIPTLVATSVCPTINATAGFTITSVSVQAVSGFTGNDIGENLSITVDFGTIFGQAAGSRTTTNNTFSADNAPFAQLLNIVLAPGTTSIATFNVNQTHSFLDAGLPFSGGISGQVRLVTTEARIPTGNEIPEPSTVALMGAGLVGVAAFARRKR